MVAARSGAINASDHPGTTNYKSVTIEAIDRRADDR